ncbi:MAG: AbrB/MazE/SpoVT family DNA-binding domain-containing protein [SAR324 cluster bacterium]
MTTATSRLTKKYQATIPKPVRAALRLKAGDTVAFDIAGGLIRLRKARKPDLVWERALEGTLSEWSGKSDERAYRDL